MDIDWQRVKELSDEVGSDDFDEIVEVFLEEVADAIKRLDPDADLSALEADLHFVKSSALNLGFSALAETCKTGERLAAGGVRPMREVANVASVFESCIREFCAGRDGIAASA